MAAMTGKVNGQNKTRLALVLGLTNGIHQFKKVASPRHAPPHSGHCPAAPGSVAEIRVCDSVTPGVLRRARGCS
ncbi:hypothetical protein JB92DRAFT_2893672 [Gautieria morchelliformis]|nr:hypothetical protein JB92DRAFT_2893672 [Gautieria morchelliformis]